MYTCLYYIYIFIYETTTRSFYHSLKYLYPSQYPGLSLRAMRLLQSVLSLPTAAPRQPAPVCFNEDTPEHVSRLSLFPPSLRLVTPESDDLPACVDVLMECFYKDALTLASAEFSAEEMEAIGPVLSIFNGGLKSLTRALLLLDTRQRLGSRPQVGGWRHDADDVLMIVLQEVESDRVLGIVELSEQPRDGRVPGDPINPLKWPPWRRPERCAYICNLAVTRDYRRQVTRKKK